MTSMGMCRNAGLIVAGLLIVASTRPAPAGYVGTTWTSASGTTAHGTLAGSAVTLSGLTGAAPYLATADLTGSDYSAHPLSSNASTVNYLENVNWSASFSAPVADPLLYAVFWRPDTATYTFTQAPTILSGFSGASVSGNDLILTPKNSFYNGILQFSGAVSTLGVTTNAPNNGYQELTFGAQTVAVPEPSSLVLLGLGLGGLALAVRHRREG